MVLLKKTSQVSHYFMLQILSFNNFENVARIVNEPLKWTCFVLTLEKLIVVCISIVASVFELGNIRR